MTERCVVVGVADKQDAAVRHAASRALQLDLPLRVVHAWDLPPGADLSTYASGLVAAFEEGGRMILDAARQVVEGVGDVDASYELVRGQAREILLEMARDAGEVVLGPDDVPWTVRLFRGRVAHALAADGPCPVVVVPDDWEPGLDRENIVVALSGETYAHGPIEFAFKAARTSGGFVTLLHVAEDDVRGPTPGLTWSQLEWMLDTWESRYRDVRVVRRTVTGRAVDVALEMAKAASLIVAGKSDPSDRAHVLHRSFPQELISRAACPVAVVPRRI